MTDESMTLIDLAEKHADEDFLRALGQYVLQELMELEAQAKCGAGKNEPRLGSDQLSYLIYNRFLIEIRGNLGIKRLIRRKSQPYGVCTSFSWKPRSSEILFLPEARCPSFRLNSST